MVLSTVLLASKILQASRMLTDLLAGCYSHTSSSVWLMTRTSHLCSTMLVVLTIYQVFLTKQLAIESKYSDLR